MGYRRFLRRLVKLGLAHGPLKRWFQRQWFAAGPQQPVDIMDRSLKFRVHPWDNTIEGKMLLGSRARDAEELDRMLEHIPSGGTFLDVGANIGYYSLVAVAGGASRALAIEPLPTAFERMLFNIRANGLEGRVIGIQAALGPERGTITVNQRAGDLASSSIVKTELPGHGVQVPMLPLADALTENGFSRVDAMKIDVEGVEDIVLCPFYANASRSLWPRFVIIEHCHRKDWKQDVLAVMLKGGYRQIGENRSNAFLELSKDI
jgi:FkbM family methyltransferase